MKKMNIYLLIGLLLVVGYAVFLKTQVNNVSNTKSVSSELEEQDPFNVVFVSNDSNFASKIELIKTNVFKAMDYTIVSSDSSEGKILIEKFGVKYLPLMVAGEAIKNTEIKDYLAQLAVEKDGQFNVDIAGIAGQMRVDIQKSYLQTPANLEFDAVSGPDDAKVIFIEISDFECPFCEKFYSQSYKKLKEKYSDRVQFRFKNLPLAFHKSAQKAAEAAQCANRQGKFQLMHDKLFENQKSLKVSNYKKWAGEFGFDQAAFDTCLDSGATVSEIKAQSDQAASFGISGTPGVFINDKFIGGAYPYETFEKLIEAELAK